MKASSIKQHHVLKIDIRLIQSMKMKNMKVLMIVKYLALLIQILL